MANLPSAPDAAREQRIAAFLAGAHDEYERIGAWYDYLEAHLHFPFRARCTSQGARAALRLGEQVEVIDLADVDDWEDQVRVTLGGDRYGSDVPLAQLQPSDSADEPTRQAVADWHYWIQRGYHFWTDDDD
jgi:hypothetical protein